MSCILRYVWDKLQRIWEAFELYLELYLIVLRLSRCCSAHLIWRYVLRFEIYMRSFWDDLRRIWFTFWDISHKGLAKNQYQVFSWLAGWLIWRYALSSLRGYLPPPLSCVWLRGQDNNVSQDGPNQDQVFFCLAGWLADLEICSIGLPLPPTELSGSGNRKRCWKMKFNSRDHSKIKRWNYNFAQKAFARGSIVWKRNLYKPRQIPKWRGPARKFMKRGKSWLSPRHSSYPFIPL